MSKTRRVVVSASGMLPAILLLLAVDAAAQKRIKDRTVLLRQSPKHFVTVVRTHAAARTVELRIEGKNDTRTFGLTPDAEVKIHGSWGRLDQLVIGDRAWIWMHKARKGEPGRIFVIADEISEQQIHGLPYEVTTVDPAGKKLELRREYGKKTQHERSLSLHRSLTVAAQGDSFVFSADEATQQPTTSVKPGDLVHVQTAGSPGERVVRLILKDEGLAELRRKQRRRLHDEFRKKGLPAAVTITHAFAGEVEVMVDHEGMRWARHQQADGEVTLLLAKKVKGVLLAVEGWHEKTRLRIAAYGPDLADLKPGQRIRVLVPEPPAAVLDSDLPVRVGGAAGRAQRIAWVLASTYCSCSIMGDVCTGMFYTLASCDPIACGMPKRIRRFVGERIDKGMTDQEILAELVKTRGLRCLRPHLLR